MAQTITDYLRLGPATSKQIQTATGLNQTAVSRQLRHMAQTIVKIPHGRTPKYALTRNAFGGDDKLSLYTIDTSGNDHLTAYLRPLSGGGFFLEPLADIPNVLLGEGGNGLYDDLPFFLQDLCPQGFIGKQIAAALAQQSDFFPPDPRYWTTDHIGWYLLANGDDLPGNLRLGQQSHLRLKQQPEHVTEEDYPKLADKIMSGIVPGSSAGGEQPKFTAYNRNHSAHVIVKFSPKGDNALAQRWRDILISEFYAAKTLQAFNYPAAETRLLDTGDRLFLESLRFDRHGEHGRSSMLSLAAIDAEFTGLGSSWPRVIQALHDQSLISHEDVFQVETLWCFGRLINNTDMHLGNLSLAIDKSALRLLPVYDMCAMGFAPKGGEITPFQFNAPSFENMNISEDTLSIAQKMAHHFWQALSTADKISDDFRILAASIGQTTFCE